MDSVVSKGEFALLWAKHHSDKVLFQYKKRPKSPIRGEDERWVMILVDVMIFNIEGHSKKISSDKQNI